MTTVTKLTGPVDPDSLAGLYVADADAPAYGTLKALVELGEARELGERYREDGVLSVAVEVAAPGEKPRRNPVHDVHAPAEGGGFSGAIGIGEDYYVSALREYSPWEEMWWREAIQNGMDGDGATGATTIRLDVRDQPDGTAVVSCEDDGPGMDKDVLINKFLMLGGTGKKGSPGATGGFGKAKELLILPWLRWKIESRDLIVEGVNSAYAGRQTAMRSGTRLEVVMPQDRKTTASHALAVLKRSLIPDVRFYVNGEYVRADLEPGEELDAFADDPDLRLYHAKKARKQKGFFIRKNGLFMFSIFMPQGVGGYIVGEVLAPSLKVFSTSRMNFNSWGLRHRLEEYVSTLSKDVRSATRKKKKQFHKVWKGVETRARPEGELRALLMNHVGAAEKIDERNKIAELKAVYASAVKKEQDAEEEADAEAEAGEPEVEATTAEPTEASDPTTRPTPPPQDPPLGRAPIDLVELFMRQAGHGAKAVEAAIDQITFLPDFYVHGEDWVPPKRITPDGDPMQVQFRKLARFWTEVCRMILIRLGSQKKFGVGWIFEEDRTGDGYTKGETMPGPEGKEYLLLNPYRGGLISEGEIYSLRNDEDLDIIWSVALHECVHLHSGIGGHDEDFSSALTSATAKASRAHRELGKIRDHVTRRTPADLARIAAARAARAAKRSEPKPQKFVESIEVAIRAARKELVKDQGDYYSFYVSGRDFNYEPRSLEYALVLRARYHSPGGDDRLRSYAGEWSVKAEGDAESFAHGESEGADREELLKEMWKPLERALRLDAASRAPRAVVHTATTASKVVLDPEAEKAVIELEEAVANVRDASSYGARSWSFQVEARRLTGSSGSYESGSDDWVAGYDGAKVRVSRRSYSSPTAEAEKKAEPGDKAADAALALLRKLLADDRAKRGYQAPAWWLSAWAAIQKLEAFEVEVESGDVRYRIEPSKSADEWAIRVDRKNYDEAEFRGHDSWSAGSALSAKAKLCYIARRAREGLL